MAGSTLAERQAGVLLHISSLPGPGPCGTLGVDAYRFVDFLVECGLSVWQVLPIGPTGTDGSPYQSDSVHAGNVRFIDPQILADAGWISMDRVAACQTGDCPLEQLLDQMVESIKRDPALSDEFKQFQRDHAFWLEDYALFRALHAEADHQPWWYWPQPLRERQPESLAAARVRLSEALQREQLAQYLFFRQWHDLKRYANQRGVSLFGDMPIFVAHDSAEVWSHRHWFDLDQNGACRHVAGVPPDYFSETGQRWGNPLYDWQQLRSDGFAFWRQRLRTQLSLFDLLRIDHFRGFESYWEIPAAEDTAIHGSWREAPGEELFGALVQEFQRLPLVAEDLGIITPGVEALRKRFGLPGMKVLLFAFDGGSDNPYLPFNHEQNSVVYTGTHDNNTTLGWYRELEESRRERVLDYLGHPEEAMPWPLIRTALGSVSRLAMLPLQDILGLDGEHRMNLPGTIKGNWQWRFDWGQVPRELPQRLAHLLELYGRKR